MTPKEKAADAERRKEYKAYQKAFGKRGEEVEEGLGSLAKAGAKALGRKAVDLARRSAAGQAIDLAKSKIKKVTSKGAGLKKAWKGQASKADLDAKRKKDKRQKDREKEAKKKEKDLENLRKKREGTAKKQEMGSEKAKKEREKLQKDREKIVGEVNEASARADARRSMRSDPDMKQKFSKDVSATDDDIKGASKNIIMQMRKAQSLGQGGDPKRKFKVEFGDGKKVEIPAKMAIAVQSKYKSMKKPADKEKFQARIGKSYKDMLSALKEELQPKKESILDRIDRKIKEKNNG